MSNNRYREKWSREETILAFDLYCKTPFSKIGKTNKDIILLANLLGRTPSSVGLKMANLAHFDPVLIAKNVKGMANGSKLDKLIFEEFANDWEELSYQAQLISSKYKNVDLETIESHNDIEIIPEGKDNSVVSRARIGQDFFRKAVLTAYGNRCCITEINTSELLIASHIKPWAISDPKTERTNPSNGLCLNAIHDKAFDHGLITIDVNYRIVLSGKLLDTPMDSISRAWFNSYNCKTINLPDRFRPNKTFIEYHNDVIFQR